MVHTVDIHVRLASFAELMTLARPALPRLARSPMDWGGASFPGYEAFMANQPRIPAATANTMLDAIFGTYADGGGKLRLYDGTQPAAGGGALSGNTLLAECTMASDAFQAASGGQVVGNGITDDSSADASGTPTWFRLTKSDGTTVILDGSAGASGCDLNINVPFVAGGTVHISSFTVTLPLT